MRRASARSRSRRPAARARPRRRRRAGRATSRRRRHRRFRVAAAYRSAAARGTHASTRARAAAAASAASARRAGARGARDRRVREHGAPARERRGCRTQTSRARSCCAFIWSWSTSRLRWGASSSPPHAQQQRDDRAAHLARARAARGHRARARSALSAGARRRPRRARSACALARGTAARATPPRRRAARRRSRASYAAGARRRPAAIRSITLSLERGGTCSSSQRTRGSNTEAPRCPAAPAAARRARRRHRRGRRRRSSRRRSSPAPTRGRGRRRASSRRRRRGASQRGVCRSMPTRPAAARAALARHPRDVGRRATVSGSAPSRCARRARRHSARRVSRAWCGCSRVASCPWSRRALGDAGALDRERDRALVARGGGRVDVERPRRAQRACARGRRRGLCLVLQAKTPSPTSGRSAAVTRASTSRWRVAEGGSECDTCWPLAIVGEAAPPPAKPANVRRGRRAARPVLGWSSAATPRRRRRGAARAASATPRRHRAQRERRRPSPCAPLSTRRPSRRHERRAFDDGARACAVWRDGLLALADMAHTWRVKGRPEARELGERAQARPTADTCPAGSPGAGAAQRVALLERC